MQMICLVALKFRMVVVVFFLEEVVWVRRDAKFVIIWNLSLILFFLAGLELVILVIFQ